MKNKLKLFIKYILLVILPTLIIINFYRQDINKYSDILFVLIFFLLNYLYNRYKNNYLDKRTLLFSILYSILYVIGSLIDKDSGTHYNILNKNVGLNLMYIYAFTIIIYLSIRKIVDKLLTLQKYKENGKKIPMIAIFLTIFLVYIIYFIALCPGMLTPDSMSQIKQAQGITELSNHHPVFHTLFIKFCLTIGNIFGDINTGVIIYSLLQITIISMIFTYFIMFLQKNNCSKYIIYFTILFYTIIPVFGIYSVTMWKDILFGVFALLLMIQVYKYTENTEFSLTDKLLISTSVFLTAMFRSNGIYVSLLVTLFLLVGIKEKRKMTLLLYLTPCIVALIIIGPIYDILNVKKGNLVESLSIPLEQLSNLVKEDVKLSDETNNYIDRLVGRDVIKENYATYSIDGVKFNSNFDNEYFESTKGQFLKIWFKNLLKHPREYVETYLKSTYGFWYIESKGYSAHIWNIDTANQFGLETENPNLASKVYNYHERIYNYPIIEYFMEPALFFISIVFLIYSSIMTKSKRHIYPLLVPSCVWVTIMMASPVSYQSRYVFALFTTFPFIVYLIYNLYSSNKKINFWR